MLITIDDMKALINKQPGRTFYTVGLRKPFTVTTTAKGFTYTLSSGIPYPQPTADMEKLLQQYDETKSLTPSDYHHPARHGSRFSSYFAALMTVMTQEANQEG